jgi:DNA-binding LacI/PurR family transcriptional regulator
MDDAGPFDLLPLAGVAAGLPSEEMGRRAMHLLAERIAEPQASGPFQHVVLPVSIHTRDEASGYLQTVRTPTR